MNPEPHDAQHAALLADLFGPGVRVAASSLRHRSAELPAAERAFVRGVVDKRDREFATGRVLARRLLEELGHPRFELLRDENRVPRWPVDVVGSISHTSAPGDGLCVVAVASRDDFGGIGVDVEPDEPVSDGLEASICLDRELAWIEATGTAAAGPAEVGRRCRIVFSVKEAVYKAFYPRVRKVWGFKEVAVDVDLDAGSFRAELPESAGRSTVEGRVFRRAGWILAGVDYV